MRHRFVAVIVAALALAFLVSQTARAAEKTHEGKVIMAGAGTLSMVGKDGNRHRHKVAATTRITRDGKQARLEQLMPGDTVKVTTTQDDQGRAVVIKIEALTR
jgi:hypothetical protein